jgi:hypothetical protein
MTGGAGRVILGRSRSAGIAGTVDGLWQRIDNLIDCLTPQECANYFAAAGYDAT